MQTADWQVNKVNIVVNCSKVCLRDRDSVKAFHNNFYLIYVSSLHFFAH